MNNQEATRTIAGELAGKGYITLVEDETVKNHLLKDNYGCARIYANLDSLVFEIYRNGESGGCTSEEFSDMHNELLKSIKEKFIGNKIANYVFTKTETFTSANKHRFIFGAKAFFTPFAIVTDVEVEQIKEAYQGYPPKKIREALETLDIGLAKVSLDYKLLAENDPKTFIKYFKKIDKDARVEVIALIAKHSIHPDVKKFLSSAKNHEIMLEAARQGVSK